jgi:hypothetical protein
MIYLGVLLVCVGAGVIGWAIAAHQNTRWYFVIMAAGAGFLVPIICIRAVLLADTLYRALLPPRPKCESGKCRWNDYKCVKLDEKESEYICKCGRTYVRSGTKFLRIDTDGARRPYKVLGAGHRWRDDC